MIRILLVLAVTATVFTIPACDKEKIVESTEYIETTEYIELPPDTVLVNTTDTVLVGDTVVQTVMDTIIQVNTIFDTVYATDTVVIVQEFYDTVTVVDTVIISESGTDTLFVTDTVTVTTIDTITVTVTDTVTTVQCSPNEHMAFTALQFHSNPVVLDFTNQNFGLADGWIYYLTEFQSDITVQSSSVYDIYGLIDYWSPDFQGYHPLEYFWRMTFNGGDPTNPSNWQMSEPPGGFSGQEPGIRVAKPAFESTK